MLKKRKIEIVTLAVIILIAIAFMVTQSAKASPYIPSANLNFDVSNKTVDVFLGANRTAVFNGTLESDCMTSYTIRLEVSNESNIPPDWSIAISPSNISHEEGLHIDYINVTVCVPLRESCGNVANIKITVYAKRWGYELEYIVDCAEVNVSVNLYYELSITSTDMYKEVFPNNDLTFNIEAHNNGNTDEIFGWFVENKEELNYSGLEVNFVFLELTIENSSVKHNFLKVHIYKWVEPGTFEIKINVSSANVSNTITLTVIVKEEAKNAEKPVFIPGFDITLLLIAVGGCGVFLRQKHDQKRPRN